MLSVLHSLHLLLVQSVLRTSGVSVGGEAINTTANACLDVWHPILRREQIINGFNDSYNHTQGLGGGVSDIDAKSAFYNCCRFFFGD